MSKTATQNQPSHPIQFVDKGAHYELWITDDFETPDKQTPYLTEIFNNLHNANKAKELHIFICSDGGELAALFSFLQLIKQFNHVVTVAIGKIYSAGADLWLAGDERYIESYTTVMFHAIQYNGMITSSGPALQSSTEFFNNITDDIAFNILKLDKILTEEELKEYKLSEVWLTGQELIKRKAAKPYAKYRERFTPETDTVYTVSDGILMKLDKYCPNNYIPYIKLDVVDPITYQAIVEYLNCEDKKTCKPLINIKETPKKKLAPKKKPIKKDK